MTFGRCVGGSATGAAFGSTPARPVDTFPRLVAAAALALIAVPATARQAASPPAPGVVSVAVGRAANPDELRRWDAWLDGLTRTGELVVVSRLVDRTLPARRHEYLAQLFEGVRVHGAGVSRQLDRGVTVSAFGTIHTAIDIAAAPTLTIAEAAGRLVQRAGSGLVDRRASGLVVLPSPGGSYELTYRLPLDDARTYFVSAVDGAVVHAEPAFESQSAVGTGAGFLGDAKKMSTSRGNGRFEAHDRLRPGGIVTLDAGFDPRRLDVLTGPGPFRVPRWTSGDVAADADNDWADPAVVDGHVHMGWTYDYFARRHGWEGLDGRNGRVVGIVNHRSCNAWAYAPPYGPEGAGVYVFGERCPGRGSSVSQPRVALHTVAHELTHGLTFFALSRRTGGGLSRRVEAGRLGPPSFEYRGETYTCGETRFPIEVEGEWVPLPALCSEDGRFVLGFSHAGAISEAFSDIFAVSAGFFHEADGASGSYEYGGDYAAGAVRSLSDPWSLRHAGAYPHRYEFALAHDGRRLHYSGALFVDRELQDWSRTRCCYGASHWNSTILSHAFHLAIEGGMNLGTELTVAGAGAGHRDEVERVFFRALTELMPQSPSLPLAADVIRQAAADLAAGTPVQRAVEQALAAVGLPPR